MRVVIGIDEKNRKDFIERLKSARNIFPRNTWFHMDVADLTFSSFRPYFDISTIKKYSSRFNFEAHLMVSGKKNTAYLKRPLKKIWVHVSTVKNWGSLLKEAKNKKISVGAAVDINEKKFIEKIPKNIKSIMVLAVVPGRSGQKFNRKALKLVSFLRKKYPHATIMVDGGMNPITAKLSKHKGADEILSTSYIWNDKNPKEAYCKLKAI